MKVVVWLTFLLLLAVYAFFRPNRTPKEAGTVLRQPRLILYTGIAGCMLFGGIATAMIYMGRFSSLTGIVLSWGFVLVFLSMSYGMLLSYLNWCVELFENSFAYSTFLGRRYEYRYEEIAYYKHVADGTAVRMKDGKTIRFEHINASAYFKFKLFASRSLGELQKSEEFKPRFLGMEMHGKRLLAGKFLLLLHAILLAGGISALIFIDTGAPYHESNTKTISVRYNSGEVKGRDTKFASFVFRDVKGTVYQVSGFAYDVFAQDDFLQDIQKDDALYLTLSKEQYFSDTSPLDVIDIQEEVWRYLSMEDVNHRYIQNGVLGKWLGIIIAPLSLFMMLFIVYLLRNPQRFAKGQKMLFGNNYREYI